MGKLTDILRGVGLVKSRQLGAQIPVASDPLQVNKPDAPRSAFLDQFLALAGGLQWREQHGTHQQGSFERMNALCYQLPIIGLIINTRAAQVMQFGKPVQNRYDIGFRVTLRDDKEKPSRASAKACETLTKFFYNTGVPGKNDDLRDTLPVYLRKAAWDSLLLAQDATELVPDSQGRPAQFYAIDASTIRIAAKTSPVYSDDIDNEIRYVQLSNGRVVTQYRHQDIIFGVRNATTSVKNGGYGVSELEIVSRAISSMLYAWNYNTKFFSQGNNAKGIINIPELPPDQLEEFRSAWYAMLRGVENAHATPVLSSEKDLQWIDLSRSQRDIEYQAYMDMLTKMLCAAYFMSPDEINFSYGPSGIRSALNASSDNRQKLIDSRERGLRPVLQDFEHKFNTRILWHITEDFKYEFVGLDNMTMEESQDFDTKRVTSTHTLNEVRASQDLPPLEGGDIVLNPTFLQNKLAHEQMAQGGQPGVPGMFGGQPMLGQNPLNGNADDAEQADADNADTAQAEAALADVEDFDGETPYDQYDGVLEDDYDDVGKSQTTKTQGRRSRVGAWRF